MLPPRPNHASRKRERESDGHQLPQECTAADQCALSCLVFRNRWRPEAPLSSGKEMPQLDAARRDVRTLSEASHACGCCSHPSPPGVSLPLRTTFPSSGRRQYLQTDIATPAARQAERPPPLRPRRNSPVRSPTIARGGRRRLLLPPHEVCLARILGVRHGNVHPMRQARVPWLLRQSRPYEHARTLAPTPKQQAC